MKIFISYRRDDSAGYAGRLFDFLARHFGEKNVFMDIDTIQPGDDFRKVVTNAVGTCDVVLVMIGRQWLSMVDAQGHRRLDDPRDWVRVEISAALANPRVRVIPVLVRNAAMPGDQELPDNLKELSWRNAIELSDTRFPHDARKLVDVIERVETGGKHKVGVTGYWGIALGVVGLALLFGIVGYGIRAMRGSRTPTPVPIASSTNAPLLTLTPTEMLAPSPTLNPPTATLTAAATIEPSATGPVLSSAVQVVDLYFGNINDAANPDDLIRSWNLMTYNFQCNPSDQCQFTRFRDFWWKWHVVYDLYDCGPDTVVVKYSLAPRTEPSSPSSAVYYEHYVLAEENGVLKINTGHLIDSLESNCSPVESLQ